VLNAAPTAPGGFVTSWEQDVTFKLDLGEGRIAGFFPTGDGDWNADGRRDLLHPSGDDAMAIRLGEPGALGPTFGKPVGEQPMPLSAGRLRVADLDGDGLDDLVAYDPYDTKGRVFVFYNRGILPGTKPGS
jgi:hypothetical protein